MAKEKFELPEMNAPTCPACAAMVRSYVLDVGMAYVIGAAQGITHPELRKQLCAIHQELFDRYEQMVRDTAPKKETKK